jgi:hypothetical protein
MKYFNPKKLGDQDRYADVIAYCLANSEFRINETMYKRLPDWMQGFFYDPQDEIQEED